MLDHVGINCSDFEAATGFYDVVLERLGFRRVMEYGQNVGYGSDKPDFWVSAQPSEGPAAGPNREIHVAFSATSVAAVRDFFEAARSLGAEVLHEPRFWPEYHEHYFGAFVRDPDGNNVEAVCHTADPAAAG